MNKEEFKADHFKNIRELLETCKMWIRDEDYDALGRWFDLGALEELINYIEKQQKEIEAYKCLAEENENCILNYKCGNDYIDCETCLKEYIKEIEND